MMVLHSFLTLLALLVGCCCAEASVMCRDNDNKPVDWYIIYKLPVKYHNVSREWPFPPHLYMDSNNPIFKLSKQSLNETSQATAYTLQQAYSNHLSQDMGYIFYNDEKPVEAGGDWTEAYGHTKGVTVFDVRSGFWLIHSVPKFPPPTNSSYKFADNAVYYGQHLFCISLNSAIDMALVGKQLMYNEPWIYDSNLPPTLKSAYPVMARVIAGEKTVNVSSVVGLASTKLIHFVSFAKNHKFNNDLYAALVAPTLKCNLSVETWQNGKGNLPPACNQTYKVETVLGIKLEDLGINFSDHEDHSKFAICQKDSMGSSTGWFCIGDINRQEHQMVRGGGTVCFYKASINSQYLSLVQEVAPCARH